jgi:peroxiredoxin
MKENNSDQSNEHDIRHWVEDRLSARLPDIDWEPNASRGFARLLASRAKQRRGRPWAWVAVGLMVTSLSLAAVPATRVFAQRCISACVNQSSKMRQFFMGTAAEVTGSNVFLKTTERQTAPDFTLSDATGQPIKLSDFRGKVVVLNFWATWCVPCRVEVPLLNGFQQTYGNRNVAVLGISLDEDGWTSVKPYMEEKSMSYRVMIGTNDVALAYGGLQTIPTTLVIDRFGRIAATHLGLCRKDEYEADIQAVLNE